MNNLEYTTWFSNRFWIGSIFNFRNQNSIQSNENIFFLVFGLFSYYDLRWIVNLQIWIKNILSYTLLKTNKNINQCHCKLFSTIYTEILSSIWFLSWKFEIIHKENNFHFWFIKQQCFFVSIFIKKKNYVLRV